jgi:hypothetical protein
MIVSFFLTKHGPRLPFILRQRQSGTIGTVFGLG